MAEEQCHLFVTKTKAAISSVHTEEIELVAVCKDALEIRKNSVHMGTVEPVEATAQSEEVAKLRMKVSAKHVDHFVL